MTKTFTISPGEHYFKGLKFQELFYPIIMLIVTLGLSFSPFVQNAFVWGGLGASVLLYFFALWKLSDLEIQAKFSPECIYTLESNFDQINKLYGLGEGMHHKDSARFGWRCIDGKNIEIMAYTYVNGERASKKLMDCTTNEWLKLDLYKKKGEYVFIGENEDGEKAKVSMPRRGGFFFGRLFTYKLFPYFGGSIGAPHQMTIEVVEKEK